MAKEKDTIITRSNYTYKEKHKVLSSGTIYERDFMTINGGIGPIGKDVIPYSNSNFKFVRRETNNNVIRHNYGGWIENENGRYWTLKEIPEPSSSITNETKIVLNPNHKCLTDFVYYGSCKELILATLRSIILTYPGQLFVTNEGVKAMSYEARTALTETVSDIDNYNLLSNPFNINMGLLTIDNSIEDINPLRYFCKSSLKYNVYDKFNGYYGCISKWESDRKTDIDVDCLDEGYITAHITLKLITENGTSTEEMHLVEVYTRQGYKYLVDSSDKDWDGYSIRPNNAVINSFFSDIDEFSKTLLDRDTNPIYTATFETPEWTDSGWTYHYEDYTWPQSDNWNIDVESTMYGEYLNRLLKIADIYDTTRTDNLWGRMTHDSIKNMDLTYTRDNSDESITDYRVGITKLRGLFMSYGRLFDDLKMAIDNIKYTNNITYSNDNNAPDYFVKYILENRGWEVTNVVSPLDQNATVVKHYPSKDIEYTTSDVNVQFMRELILNSKTIFQRKGTKAAIEMLLGLFGFKSYNFARASYSGETDWDELGDEQLNYYDYRIDEYVGVASPKGDNNLVPADEQLPVEKYNAYKNNYVQDSPDNVDTLQGLPVMMVYITMEEESGETQTYKYIVPWFNSLKETDGEIYFQMYGGWGKFDSRDGIEGTEKTPIYSETINYLKIVRELADLAEIPYAKLNNGDIYYVNYLDNYSDFFGVDSGDDTSHYFIIQNKEESVTYGDEGWNNIPVSDINNGTENGVRILYLESIVDNFKGNNPHIGYGNYDDGEGFFDYLRQLFKYSIENNNFASDVYDCETGEIIPEIPEIGFNILEMKDNMKCAYYRDKNATKTIPLIKQNGGIEDEDGNYETPMYYEEYEDTESKFTPTYTTELKPYDFETQESGEFNESSANSVINSKKLTIEFNDLGCSDNSFKDYLYKSVIPYLVQIIPSTTIWSVKVNTEDVSFVAINTPEVAGCVNRSE